MMIMLTVNHLSGKKKVLKNPFQSHKQNKNLNLCDAPMFTLSSVQDSLKHCHNLIGGDQLSAEGILTLKVC